MLGVASSGVPRTPAPRPRALTTSPGPPPQTPRTQTPPSAPPSPAGPPGASRSARGALWSRESVRGGCLGLPLPGSPVPGPGPTFDKELRAALLAAHHALVGRVVRQRALADGQGALGTVGLEDVPGRGRGGGVEAVARLMVPPPCPLLAPSHVVTLAPSQAPRSRPYLLWNGRGRGCVPGGRKRGQEKKSEEQIA